MTLLLTDVVLLCLFSAWAALAAWGCVYEGFLRWVVGHGGWRLCDNAFEDLVEMAGQLVASWIDVDEIYNYMIIHTGKIGNTI